MLSFFKGSGSNSGATSKMPPITIGNLYQFYTTISCNEATYKKLYNCKDSGEVVKQLKQLFIKDQLFYPGSGSQESQENKLNVESRTIFVRFCFLPGTPIQLKEKALASTYFSLPELRETLISISFYSFGQNDQKNLKETTVKLPNEIVTLPEGNHQSLLNSIYENQKKSGDLTVTAEKVYTMITPLIDLTKNNSLPGPSTETQTSSLGMGGEL